MERSKLERTVTFTDCGKVSKMTVENFCLPESTGNKVCLNDFLGKWIILYFYPKDNTSGCTKEANDFNEKLGEIEKLNGVVIGISPDDEKSHKKFIEKHGLKIILLSDTEKKILKRFDVWKEKSMYGRKYMGVMRTTLLINPKGEIVKRWDKVRVKGHVEEVIEELKKHQ